jgi:hypothetical protein
MPNSAYTGDAHVRSCESAGGSLPLLTNFHETRDNLLAADWSGYVREPQQTRGVN